MAKLTEEGLKGLNKQLKDNTITQEEYNKKLKEYFEIEASSLEEAEEIANENAEALFDKDENNNSYAFIYDYCVNG